VKFIDSAKIMVRSGDGGDGCVSFRREKYIPKGGPDGGNGGRGGDIVFQANPQLTTLLDFKYRQHYRAQSGKPGEGQQKTGRNSPDRVIEVPLGTLILDENSGEILADMVAPQQIFIVAKGGRGGRGNLSYVSSTNQAPRQFEKGKEGIEKTLRLELKILADIALVGFPNAGKSTLLSSISAAKPKIASYPFTTLTPQLGVVELEPGRSFVVADIPGLISGAHSGKGLGIRFLKHLERSHLLWFVIDVGSQKENSLSPLEKYHCLWQELLAYEKTLQDEPHVVVLNKMDLNPDHDFFADLCQTLTDKNVPFFLVSAVSRQGLKDLLWQSYHLLGAIRIQNRQKEKERGSTRIANCLTNYTL
jgi:GTP-binding protein